MSSIFLQGWWKGELRGQVGLFPDNFVELLSSKSEQRRPDPEQYFGSNQGTSKSTSSKHSSYTRQRGEKAHARKSLDSRLVHTGEKNNYLRNNNQKFMKINKLTDLFVSAETSLSKTSTSSASSTISSSTSQTAPTTSADKKPVIGNHSIISSVKRLVGDGNSADGNDRADTGLGEELDGVERGEGAPLSHLTASRAKAPRRRLPSTQLLRNQTSTVSEYNYFIYTVVVDIGGFRETYAIDRLTKPMQSCDLFHVYLCIFFITTGEQHSERKCRRNSGTVARGRERCPRW